MQLWMPRCSPGGSDAALDAPRLLQAAPGCRTVQPLQAAPGYRTSNTLAFFPLSPGKVQEGLLSTGKIREGCYRRRLQAAPSYCWLSTLAFFTQNCKQCGRFVNFMQKCERGCFRWEKCERCCSCWEKCERGGKTRLEESSNLSRIFD